MVHPDYNSPNEIRQFLMDNGMSMQKKFGQNFLINNSARNKIIDRLDLQPGMSVWEIGPGLGSMTEELLKRGAVVTVFEIDRGFVKFLKDFFEKYIEENKLCIVEGDVLKTWKTVKQERGVPERLFGNLPYNIAATIIGDTIQNDVRFESAVFTVQKEVAQRITAKPGTEDYSSFSILCQWAYDVSSFLDLSGGNFWPKPNVDSRSILMTKKVNYPICKNKDLFMKMQRSLFISRRKNIRNNLTSFLSSPEKAKEYLTKAAIPEDIRAESVGLEKMLELSDIINADIIKS